MFKCEKTIKILYNVLGVENIEETLSVFKTLNNNEEENYDDLISKKMKHDYIDNADNEFICCLYNFYIQAILRLYAEENLEEAISRYEEMCEVLIEYYGIEIKNDKEKVFSKK